MKKAFLVLLALLLISSRVFAQNDYGKVWVLGGSNIFSTTFNVNNTVTNTLIDSGKFQFFAGGHSNICDSAGNLILCSDGYNIYGKNLSFLDGGDTLCPLAIYQWWDGFASDAQTSIFLPKGNNEYYFVNNTISDSFYYNTSVVGCDQLSYSVVDMKANGGNGKVVKRMEPMLRNNLLSYTGMTACKHGDGKSWWLLKQGHDSNNVFKFLLTPDSVYHKGQQYFSYPIYNSNSANGQAMFNQNGTQYAVINELTDSLFLTDFDRCSGVLTNPRIYSVPYCLLQNPNDSLAIDSSTNGICFSHNGRFIYVSKLTNILQLDLQDSNPQTQWSHIAGLDTTWGNSDSYSSLYLGLDNKVYIGYGSNSSGAMSVINNPDVKGNGCDFCKKCNHYPPSYYQGTFYYTGVTSPPNMPNYKLGATNPPCSVGVEEVIKEKEEIKVYPNPATGLLTIETNQKGQFEIMDMLGRVMLNHEIRSSKIEMDISSFPSGVYVYRLTDGGVVVGMGKVVKE